MEKFEDRCADVIGGYLTGDISGPGGVIKSRAEDFVVEEVPLYEASGAGTHVYFFVEKKGLTTPAAAERLAKAVGKSARDVGYAGLKDSNAVTRQWMSVEHVKEERLAELEVPGVKVLEVSRHGNKLKLGHLKANRFWIKVRKMDVAAAEAAQRATEIMEVLGRRGVPNWFGMQRFGNRCTNHQLGRALLKGNVDEFLSVMLGRGEEGDGASEFAARRLYDEGKFEEAMEAWPRSCSMERRVLSAVLKRPDKKYQAVNAVDRRLVSLFVSAYQSYVFNKVLERRMPDVDKLLGGDMAYKHVNGACFRVEDAAAEQARCDAFEISPTGPIYGAKMTEVTGEAVEFEGPVIREQDVSEEEFRTNNFVKAHGARRAMRFEPRGWKVACGSDDAGEFLELSFELESGCYATTVMREILKVESE